ncbi:MAG: hypothetical protein ACK5NG_02080 [Chthoniobacterales bacterium]
MKQILSLTFLLAVLAAMTLSTTSCQRFPASETVIEDAHGKGGHGDHSSEGDHHSADKSEKHASQSHGDDGKAPTYFPDQKAD